MLLYSLKRVKKDTFFKREKRSFNENHLNVLSIYVKKFHFIFLIIAILIFLILYKYICFLSKILSNELKSD